jgi:hypothetical protein
VATFLSLNAALHLSKEAIFSQLLKEVDGVHQLLTLQGLLYVGGEVFLGFEVLLSVFHVYVVIFDRVLIIFGTKTMSEGFNGIRSIL